MKDAVIGGLTEVEMGKLAQQKGESDAVKQFGKKLEDDHTKANDESKGVAQKLNVELPAKLDKKHQADVGKFSKLSGQKFDEAFARHAVSDHEKDISKFRKEAKDGRNAEVTQFASQTLPTLEDHLKMVRDLHGSGKAKK